MTGFLLAGGATVVALTVAALFGKQPPPPLTSTYGAPNAGSLRRWATLLDQTAGPPANLDSLAWNAGDPVQPVAFTAELASLQMALGQAQSTGKAEKFVR